MLAKFATIFKIPELRRKIYLTLFLLFVYRMGFFIPLPTIDQGKMQETFAKMQSSGDPLAPTARPTPTSQSVRADVNQGVIASKHLGMSIHRWA